MKHHSDSDWGGHSYQSLPSRCHCRFPRGHCSAPAEQRSLWEGHYAAPWDAKKARYSGLPLGPQAEMTVRDLSQTRRRRDVTAELGGATSKPTPARCLSLRATPE
ncbi:hypothetical protein AMECASPLE_032051 [Ameca splendens]|uniref:Uncharacterized protein n=1 Tax=Ameca splendens TaxID=208324 RepID=A0ABV0YIH9_9TELE